MSTMFVSFVSKKGNSPKFGLVQVDAVVGLGVTDDALQAFVFLAPLLVGLIPQLKLAGRRVAIDARPTDHPFPRLVRRNHRIGRMLLELDDPLHRAGPIQHVVVVDKENRPRQRSRRTLLGVNHGPGHAGNHSRNDNHAQPIPTDAK